MPIDATMWLASCTKLLTVVAAMQCVERGQLELDGDVTPILSELKGIKILRGFEKGPDGKDRPILIENTETITLRHLLTHTSGLGYDFFSKSTYLYIL
jgi:CubicO group peptidase (beta-lactamase class C family)